MTVAAGIVVPDEVRVHWARWGATAGIVGMVAWVAGTGLIPLDMKLEHGDRRVAVLAVTHAAQLDGAALLAVAGGVRCGEQDAADRFDFAPQSQLAVELARRAVIEGYLLELS